MRIKEFVDSLIFSFEFFLKILFKRFEFVWIDSLEVRVERAHKVTIDYAKNNSGVS